MLTAICWFVAGVAVDRYAPRTVNWVIGKIKKGYTKVKEEENL